MIKSYFNIFSALFIFLVWSLSISGQTTIATKEKHYSVKYGYSIEIPISFSKKTPKQKNTDMLFADSYGSSINLNVTDRLPDEYNITAHNYSKEMLERETISIFPNYTITYSEKTYVGGEKAFICENYGMFKNLSMMHCYFYYKNKAYVITCATESARFKNYKTLFKSAIKSIHLL